MAQELAQTKAALAIEAEKHKAALSADLERVKSELGHETEKLKAELNKQSESHKLKLKKAEILFEKEIEAAKAFLAFRQRVEPSFRHPDMDWDEAMEDVLENCTDTEDRGKQYMIEHGAFLTDANRKLLLKAIEIASTHQFAMTGQSPYELKDSKEAAQEMLKLLGQVEEQFIRELRT